MKKIIFVTVLFIAFIVWLFMETTDGASRFVGVVAAGIVWFACVDTFFGLSRERESLNQPKQFTDDDDDAGTIFKVKDLVGGKVGVVTWGYNDVGIGELNGFKTYYFTDQLPRALREKGVVFKIEPGPVFRKVIVHGYSDKTKQPFEISSEKFA